MSKKRSSAPNISKDALERARRELYSGGGADVNTLALEEATAGPTRPTKQRQAEEELVYTSTKRTMTRDELAEEYSYVLRDLTSMAILASILFVVLVVVALVVV